jgi:tRNA threonylcarbamoyladenosine biosynthesis protein TsaE
MKQFTIFFDLYRKRTEALDMGVDDYLYSGAWCFIEWAEQIPNLIPEEHSVELGNKPMENEF